MDFFLFFWIFMIAAFLGDILETIFCYALTGEIMCRSSFLFGHFSAVWGAGAVLLTCLFCNGFFSFYLHPFNILLQCHICRLFSRSILPSVHSYPPF